MTLRGLQHGKVSLLLASLPGGRLLQVTAEVRKHPSHSACTLKWGTPSLTHQHLCCDAAEVCGAHIICRASAQYLSGLRVAGAGRCSAGGHQGPAAQSPSQRTANAPLSLQSVMHCSR